MIRDAFNLSVTRPSELNKHPSKFFNNLLFTVCSLALCFYNLMQKIRGIDDQKLIIKRNSESKGREKKEREIYGERQTRNKNKLTNKH